MIKKFIRFWIFIILSLSATPALTQYEAANGYSVQHFTDENGLPQNSINDLLFDNDGYLWLASQVGLVRFNGASFKLYYPDDKPVMESNIVYLGKNDKGVIYFQTDDHNLYRYAGNNSQFLSPVNTAALKKPFLLNARKQLFDFTSFLRDVPPGPEANRRKVIFRDLFDNNRNFFAADSGRVYLVHEDSLYFFDGKALNPLSLLPGNSIQFLLYDGKLYLLDEDKVTAVYEDGRRIGNGRPILGDLHKDAAAGGMEKEQFHLYTCGRTNHLLVGHKLYRIFPDKEGNLVASFVVNLDFIPDISAVEYNPGLDLLLIATPTEGFYFLRRNNFGLSTWPASLRQKLARYLFGPLALRNGKEILTDKFIFRPDGWVQPVKDSLPIWQRCLYLDKKDQVWGALFNLPRLLTPGLEPVKVLPALDATILDYTEDTDGHLYCLTERSIWRLESAGPSGQRDSFRLIFTQSPTQSSNETFVMVSPHRFWLATDNGLTEYDLDSRQAHNIPELDGAQVRAIHVCLDGSILLGTYGQGYFYFYQHRWFRMPLDKNGFLITAHCFLEDKHANIWISCNKGLFKVPRADMDAWCAGGSSQLYYYYYGRQDGLLTNEFNGGFNAPGLITPDGFVTLLSMKGLVCFYADSLQTDFPHGAIDMTHIEVDGTAVERSDTITLPAGYNNLSLEISCPYLGNMNNLYLQYNLKGLNSEWKEISADGIVNLSRLAPGSYTLMVRKVNGFGKDNYQYRQWNITVPPLFYRTLSFLILLALVVLILLILLVQLRLKLVEKKKEIRVKAEKLRGAVVRLEETVAMLQESEKALLKTNAQREKLISLVIHDLRSPLRFLTMLAGDLHDNQANLSPAESKDRTYLVKKGAQDIYNFSEDFLLWVTSQKDNFSTSSRLFHLRPLLQEIYDFFNEQVQQRGNSISYEADENLRVYSDPHVLITIIRNLTDNANKYTSHGSIRIKAMQQGEDVVISITDTGKGMTPQQIAAFLGNDTLENVRSGSQLGHKFIFDLTQRLNGSLSVESTEQTGTTVTLKLPMG
jgi:signal transduction histidine kinase/ligand-binding sensor domain-containing protein